MIRVIEMKDNPVVERKEIKFQMDYEKHPTRKEIKEALVKELKLDGTFVVVRRIRHVFGMRRIIGLAHAYESLERLKKFEPKHIIKRWLELGEEKAEGQEQSSE